MGVAGRPTLAVVGCGPDIVYPPANAGLIAHLATDASGARKAFKIVGASYVGTDSGTGGRAGRA